MKDVISIKDFQRQDIESLIQQAMKRKKEHTVDTQYKGKVACLFFEDSTRTRVSSEQAVINLGYEVTGFSGTEGTSVKKGEPLLDTVRMFRGYGVKAVFMRHNLAGAARHVADNMDIPIINAGDGSNSHPTQTLLDLLTIYEKFGKIDGLNIALVGDLKYGRTVHSLLQALELFDTKVTLLSPHNLKMPHWRIRDYEKNSGNKVYYGENIKSSIADIDVLYMTRIQRERFPSGPEGEIEFNKVAGHFNLRLADIEGCKDSLCILHPLPRDKKCIEIHPEIDRTPYAYYFIQAENGLYMREAIAHTALTTGFQGRGPKIWKNENEIFQELPIKNGSKIGEKLVYRLDSGILIDHIEQGRGMKVYQMLGLNETTDNEVVICTNIRSGKMQRKDVLAIHNKQLTPEQFYKVALVSQSHTINYIENQKVYKKGKAILPPILEGHLVCKNERCISRSEHKEFIDGRFYVESHNPLEIRCHYCEKVQRGDEIEIRY